MTVEDEQSALQRLAAYEDTGIEPREIQDYVPLLKEWHENTGALRYIHELLQAEEQGLLIRLPCKVGDTVYILGEYGDNGEFGIAPLTAGKLSIIARWVETGVIGKTIFLTREEAALAKEG